LVSAARFTCCASATTPSGVSPLSATAQGR
jgi:hypothetical protein